MSNRPAVIVPAFSRPLALQRLLSTLNRAHYPGAGVNLVISLDGGFAPEVREIAERFQFAGGKKTVIDRSENIGLRDHILWCGDQTESHGAVIVLEDDLVVDPYFYQYASAALRAYEATPSVAGIALYSPCFNEFSRLPFEPIFNGTSAYFAKTPCSWGQAWTLDQWRDFRTWYAHCDAETVSRSELLPPTIRSWPDSSWKKFFALYLATSDRYFVYPYVALSSNCADAGGTHVARGSQLYQVPLGAPVRSMEKWCFPEFDAVGLRYDPFLEPEADFFEALLGVPQGELCIDLYGCKPLAILRDRNYCLTSRATRSAIQRFPLVFKPVEANMSFPEEVGQAAFFSLSRSYDVIPGKTAPRSQWLVYFSYFDLLGFRDIFRLFFSAMVRRFRK